MIRAYTLKSSRIVKTVRLGPVCILLTRIENNTFVIDQYQLYCSLVALTTSTRDLIGYCSYAHELTTTTRIKKMPLSSLHRGQLIPERIVGIHIQRTTPTTYHHIIYIYIHIVYLKRHNSKISIISIS